MTDMTTSTSPSLLDWILKLLGDSSARTAFQSDPDGYAASHGFSNLSGGDVHDALCLAADCAPAHADESIHLPSPPHYHGGGGSHYLKSYINHYETIERHDTFVDNSVHQDIDTHGGDFHQVMDNDPVVASGDGAVAAHGDIKDATLTTGAANRADLGHSSLGDGGSLSIGGNADAHNTESDTRTSAHNSGDGSTTVNAAGPDGHANNYADQHESDTSSHSHYDDDSRSDSHNALNSHNDSQYDDSHNYANHGY
jgi:hypothetical protein